MRDTLKAKATPHRLFEHLFNSDVFGEVVPVVGNVGARRGSPKISEHLLPSEKVV
jgi:hypothetical protein